MWKVPLFELNYDETELRAAADVIASRWLTMGERIDAFEQAFAEFLGGEVEATAVSSCTAALHMAVLMAGVGPGDEVIIPALTFVADANVVAMTGATPVLADSVSLDDWNVSAETIRARITGRTRAVIVVHYAGYPCAMDEIVALCRERDLFLIEDVAHAPGASWRGSACGVMGDVGCFSFFSNKNLSIGEGGMLVTADPELHQRARHLRSHGMTTLTLDRHKGRAISYDVVRPGLNYRMDEIRAAIGLAQLEKLVEANRRRGELVRFYVERLAGCEGVDAPFQSLGDVEPAWHIAPVLLDEAIDRERVIGCLREQGIQSSIHYPSFRAFSAWRDHEFPPTPVADRISDRVLTLPLFPTMTFDQVDAVVEALMDALPRCRQEV